MTGSFQATFKNEWFGVKRTPDDAENALDIEDVTKNQGGVNATIARMWATRRVLIDVHIIVIE
jgi:hypothetical protein